ncbi:MAG: AEC family transporter [Solobacterium sp.]|nr:AEC family transporter [Solobacterium sp.]
MSIAVLLAKQILMMFLLMAVGIILYKRKMVTDQGSKELGTILLYVVIPSVVIKTFCIEKTSEKVLELTHSFVLAAAAMLIAVVVSMVMFGKKNGVSCFSSSFSNAAFIGIPLITGTLGSEAVFYISMMIVLVNLLQWTLGVFFLTGDKSAMSVKKIITNPIVISVLIGLLIFLSGIKVPDMAITVLNTITGMNTPLAMVVSGIYLAQANIMDMLKRNENYLVSVCRLLIIPVLTVLVLKVMPVGNTTMKMAILIACASPVGSNVAIFARQYDKDHKMAIEQVCMSTVLCLLSLPLVAMLASKLF